MSTHSLLLEARHIDRRHPDGRRWLLQGVSLEIRGGERLALVGPSGSGKTLLLRALALLDPLDGGQIRWQDRPIRPDRIPAFRQQVVYLHQRPALWEETVEKALREPFRLTAYRPRRFDRARIVRRLEELGRDASFLAKEVRDLSGGECQITALLRAIQLDPAVLLLDEPTAALDPETARAVERLLGGWLAESADGRALVWASHHVTHPGRVADRMLAIEAGRLVEESPR